MYSSSVQLHEVLTAIKFELDFLCKGSIAVIADKPDWAVDEQACRLRALGGAGANCGVLAKENHP